MGPTPIAVIAVISLCGLLPAGCSKTTTSTAAANHAHPAGSHSEGAISTAADFRDLGALTLTNHYETCVDLGQGRSCIITPRLLARNDVLLTMALCSKEPDGKTSGLIVTQVSARPGKPFETAIGDLNLTLTPRLAQE